MKTLVIIISMVGCITLSSCNQTTDPSTMLENSESRTEMFKQIASNHDYMMDFMESMQTNDHAMQMMQENKEMMGMMMKGEGMQMMKTDSMMHSMMKDGKMMGNMMQMMHKNGMMSEDCMKSCMSMMKDKGMNMGQMNDDSSEDHDSHNH